MFVLCVDRYVTNKKKKPPRKKRKGREVLEDVEVGTYNCRHQTSKTKQELESSWKIGNATHLLIAPACTEKPQNWEVTLGVFGRISA